MNENKKCEKTIYRCAICDSVFESVQDRVACEMKCLKRKEEEELKAAEIKKKAEKDARYKEVTDAINNAVELLDKYVDDYGSYTCKDSNCASIARAAIDTSIINKMGHHFWF